MPLIDARLSVGELVELMLPVYTFCGSLWGEGLHLEVAEIRDAGTPICDRRGRCVTRPECSRLLYLEPTALVKSAADKATAQVPVRFLRRVA